MRAVPDPDTAAGVTEWTVGDVGAHLAGVYLAYTSLVSPGGAREWDDAPPRAYDCRVVAAAATFLLVPFRRTPIWQAVATGGCGPAAANLGRAMRLGQLVAIP